MPHRPTVLFVSPTNDRYGACRSMMDLLIGLSRRGYRPVVALKPRGYLEENLDRAGVPWFPIRTRRWIGDRRTVSRRVKQRFQDILTARRVADIARAQGVGLIHTNTLNSPVGAFIAPRLGVPHVWHMREAVDTVEGSNFVYSQRASARVIRRSSCVVACSQHLVESTSRYADSARLRLLYDGLLDMADAERPLPKRVPLSPDRPLRLLLVGKLHPRKGALDALTALAQLRDRGLDARLVVVGDGGRYATILNDHSRELGVQREVEWAGYVDPQSYYETCDISLMCGPREPLSRVAVESQAAGIPSIAVRSGGLPEVVQDGLTGWLYEEGKPDALANRIEEAVRTDPAAVRDMVEEGRRRAYARFNKDRYVSETAALYGELGLPS